MASTDINAKVKITLEAAQDAEEFIRKLVREEIAEALEEEKQRATNSRGWQQGKPWPPYEQKDVK